MELEQYPFPKREKHIQGTKRSHRYICLDGHPSTLALTAATSSECTWLKQINASSRTLEVDTKFTEVERTSLLGPSHCDESAMVCHEPLKSRASHDILRHSYLRSNCSGWKKKKNKKKKKKNNNNNNFINPIFQFTTKNVFAANTHTHTHWPGTLMLMAELLQLNCPNLRFNGPTGLTY